MCSGCDGGSTAEKSAISEARLGRDASARGPERQHIVHGSVDSPAGSVLLDGDSDDGFDAEEVSVSVVGMASGAVQRPPLSLEGWPHSACPPFSFLK